MAYSFSIRIPEPRQIKRWFRFRWQKLTRGFSDDVTWDLDHELTKWLLPRLKRFKELCNGHPMSMSAEEWDQALDEMIWALEFTIDEKNADWVKIHGKDKPPPVEMHERAAQGLALVGTYWRDIWW